MTASRTAQVSAGILLHRPAVEPGGIEVLLGHLGGPYWARKHERAWGIPKGELGPDEDARDAAAREFTEELGLPVPPGEWCDLGELRQSGGKLVHVWAVAGDLDPVAVTPGTFELEWPPHSGRLQAFPEVDRVAWLGLEEARRLVIASQEPFLDRLAEWVSG